MGNNACCSDTRSNQIDNQRVEIDKSILMQKPLEEREEKLSSKIASEHSFPEVSPQIQAIIDQKRPFVVQMSSLKNPQTRQVNQQFYYGEIDQNGFPHGYGRLYKKNGSVYIGQFEAGKAEGEGIFIFSDGSYYEGSMKDNMADSDKGRFKNESIQYVGSFRHNVFHGQGVQKGKSFQFVGQFENGFRKMGTLRWEEQANKKFTYIGQFDQKGKFTGKGTHPIIKGKLQDPLGTYQGNFKDGLKQGFGVYWFKTQIRYEGYYKNDVKHGRGSIINIDNTIAFCGEFVQGLPHGKGYATDKKGKKYSLQWNNGVYADLI